jgi:riboflavin synthase alpha subunit
MWEDDGFDVDAILTKLLAVRNKTPGSMVNLELDDISGLIERVLKIVSS